MSNPPNALDQFRSYSYHQILIACSNQQAANILSNQNDLEALQQLGAETVYTVSSQTVDGNSRDIVTLDRDVQPNLGEYIVLINGMRDTRFTIQSATWATVTAGGVNPTDRGNSIAVEGSLSIREARGFKFLNEIDRAADAFKTDQSGIMYVLKTVFVGHGVAADGTATTEIIADIKPLVFLLVDVTGAFSPMGGEYKLDFVGASNGGSRFPQISRGAEEIKFTPDSLILRDVVDQLARLCSTFAQETRDTVVKQLTEEFSGDPDNQKEVQNLRAVEYRIELDKPYNTDEYVITDIDPRYTETGEADSPGALSFGKSFTVEHAIQHILERCAKVKEDLNKGSEGQKYRYKIFSEITMSGRGATTNDTPLTTTDVEKIVVVYRVRRFLELDNASVQSILGLDVNGQPTESPTSSGTDSTQQMLQNNLIEFDFYYTGKNVDIKQFDIKLQQGLTFLQILSSTDNSMTALQQQAKGGVPDNTRVTTNNVLSNKPTESFKLRSRSPIFPSTSVKDIRSKNIGDPGEMTKFNAALSNHASLENIEIEMEIRGNPYLLNQSNRPATEDDNLDNADEERTQFNVLTNWDKMPALAKVNIRMPDSSDTPSGSKRPDFVDFWYKGFYYIYQIQHIFSEGEFTQKLSMLALPEKNILQRDDGTDAREVKVDNEKTDADNSQKNQTNTPADATSTPDTAAPRASAPAALSSQSYVDIILGGAAARKAVAVLKRANANEAISVTKPGKEQE